MKLRKLQLENFRNYSNYSYDFSLENPCTILVGPNGLGKTNFLEAIYLLSLGRSFRSLKHENLVEWKKDYYRCRAELDFDDEPLTLEAFFGTQPRRQKQFKKNDVKLSHSRFLGNLLTVLFHPEDLNLLYLSPMLRRKYLDTILSQTDRHYLVALAKYKKLLRQRNSLLQKIRERKFSGQNCDADILSLESWDFQIIQEGSTLVTKRILLIRHLAEFLQPDYQKISGQDEELEISYLSKAHEVICKPIPEIEDENELFEEISRQYLEALDSRRQLDLIKGKTSIGPHRDNFQVTINGKIIGDSASRGEFRTILLALKLAEIDYIKQKSGRNPLLLLDDVFSELDPNRQNKLLEAIKGCQTVITTTDLANIEANLGEFALIEY